MELIHGYIRSTMSEDDLYILSSSEIGLYLNQFTVN